MREWFSALSVLVVFSFCAPCMAQDSGGSVPIPESRKTLIKTLDNDIQKRAKEKAETAKAMAEDEEQLKTLRDNLVTVARDIRSAEESLRKIIKLQGALETKQAQLGAELERERGNLASMIMALQRLKRVPPETVLIKPGSPLETAQTSMILRNAVPAIEKKTKALNDLLHDYDRTKIQLDEQKASALSTKKELEAQHTTLAGLTQERERRYTRNRIVLSDHTKSLNALAKKAKDLKDLVANIEAASQKQDTTTTASRIMLPPDQLPVSGTAQLPVSGIVKTRFGEIDDFGAKAQGLSIQALTGALVVAPMGGQVKYAGPFKNFGNLVIIEHRSGYHSLIGGLEKIDVNVGQVIVSGEPVGILGASGRSMRASLYFELRRNGKPVDPSVKFSDLG